jgi:hypothetical protein
LKHKTNTQFFFSPGLIVSVVMALAFLALVVVVITPAPPSLAEPPHSSIFSEDSCGTAG